LFIKRQFLQELTDLYEDVIVTSTSKLKKRWNQVFERVGTGARGEEEGGGGRRLIADPFFYTFILVKSQC
jgi:hypothetical protein